MTNSPSKNKDRILSYTVYCNDNKLEDCYELVSASVRLELNRIGKATLTFNAGNMEKQTFDETDADLFKPGSSIRLDVGDLNKEKTIFDGIITEIRIKIGKGHRSLMEIECRDYAYPATQGRKNCIFEKKKDSDIIADILGSYGDIKVDPTDFEHPSMVQYYCTDWDFALSRADSNGLFVFTNGKNISVCKPEIAAEPVLSVTYGVDMISFDGGLSCGDQFSEYEAVSWSPSQQKMIKVTSKSPDLNKQGDLQISALSSDTNLLLQTDAPIDETVLKRWVDSAALKAGLSRYRGKFSFYGSDEAVPGCLIELQGLGKRFNGNVFIGYVHHSIENNEWITEVGMGVPNNNITDEPDVVSPPASGFLPGLEGMHIGVVKQLHDDPAKEGRICVELPWMEGMKKEIWARISTPYASDSSGGVFLPEKGDEVIVGFINQDPCHPVILGSLYDNMHKPPYEYTAENNMKAFVTRSQLKMEFDEDKKTIVFSTPGKNRIEINDDGKCIKLTDLNKNEIIMDSNGISLSSEKDIILKAKGNVMMDAAEKTEIAAKSDISLNGANIKATAKVGFSAKGNASAELSASGQTTVKGGMVMIN
ncbi:MAG: type VI secretion system tip protein VgrG [Dysgonomonas sp.]|nr:type VI secretion system tip protein VgrG [Dysgonomonas sp.]